MGRAARWLRGLLGGGKKAFSGAPPPAKEKKRWGFSKTFKENDRGAAQQRPPATVGAVEQRRGSYRDGATAYQTASMALPPPPAATVADEDEQNKHAIAVAAATAAVAEAAVAAAQAAAAVVRLTSSGRVVFGGAKREDWAAIKIQAAFRGYLARRALRALRGLVKLQALVRGNIVRKQAAETLRCMQALVRVQARARALRTEDARPKRSASLHPQLVKMKQGPPTPEKYEQATGGYALKSDRSSTLKRNSSKPVSVEFLEQDRLHSSGRNWLDRWMEERHWNSRVLAARTAMVSGIDDEKSAKILEIDPGKPQHKPNSRSHHLNSSCSTLASDLNSHSFTSVQASPSKDSTTAQLSVPSPSSVDMPESLSPLRFHAAVEAADPADSPQFYSASSRPGSARKGPYTPSQSDCSRSMFSGCSYYPNYMANTESSRAKARSQSAPKQRPEIEKSGSVKRILVHHGFGQQQQASSATTQRSSSLHSKFTNKAYPGSGRLDRLGMPLGM